MQGNKIWREKKAADETPQDHKKSRTQMCRNGMKPTEKRKVRYLLLKWITTVFSPHLTSQQVSVEAEYHTVSSLSNLKKKSVKNRRFPFLVTQIKREILKPHSNIPVSIVSKFSL